MNLFGKPKGSDVTIEVEGMTCGHCTARVEKALKSCSGVTKVKINLNKKNAVVWYGPSKTDTNEFVKKIEEAGYKAKIIA